MKSIKPRIREIIVVSLIGGLLGGAYVFMVMPVDAQLSAMQTDVRLRRKSLERLRNVTNEINDLNQRANALHRKSTVIDRRFQPQPLIDLQALATQLQLDRCQISPTELEQTPARARQTIPIDIHGSYAAVYQFIEHLESLSALRNFSHLSLEPDQTGSGVSAQITLELYTSPQERT